MLLTAGLLLDWGRFYGRGAGVLAAALWLGNPLVVSLGTSAYIDITLALFVTAALNAWERWARTADPRWLCLAGAFAGLGAGAKYLGLFFLAAFWLMIAIRASKARDLKPIGYFTITALVGLAPWYLWIVYHTGNPVFPFYTPLFGTSAWGSTEGEQIVAAVTTSSGSEAVRQVAENHISRIVRGLPHLALVPFTAVFDRGEYNWSAPLSPAYLFLIPLCAPFALLDRRTRGLVVLVAAYALFWLAVGRDIRYLVTVLPVLNVVLAATLVKLPEVGVIAPFARKSWLRKFALPLSTLLLVAPGPLYAGYKIFERGGVPVSGAQRSNYLERQLPGYAAIAAMNDLEGSDYTVYGLFAENLRYYADGRFLGDWRGPNRFSRVLAVLEDSEALGRHLREWGACFFLVRHSRPRELRPADSVFGAQFEELVSGDDFLLYRLTGVPCSRQSR